MKLILSVLLALPLLAQAELPKSFGAKINQKTPLLQISKLLASPDDFAEKKIRVEGLVTGVCAHRGCWITLASDKEFETLRVKVQDGAIVFPVELKGKKVQVEGIFKKIVRKAAHKCPHAEKQESKGEHKGCGGCAHKNQDQVYYQLQGLGAVTL